MDLESKDNRSFLLKDVKVADVKNERLYLRDVLVVNGVLKEKDSDIPDDIYVIDGKQNLLIPDTIDIHVHTRDPGFLYKETLETALRAAARGGFTKVVAMPNTFPVIDDVKKYKDVIRRADRIKGSELIQACSLSVGLKGEKLNDFDELIASGVICFSDDGLALYDNLLMKEAMDYFSRKDCALLLHSQSKDIAPENSNSEVFGIYRDIILSELTGCRIHIQHVSKRESVDMIRNAKARGVKVSCEVCPHHLFLNDRNADVASSSYKVNPPLRTCEDSKYLLLSLIQGDIDVIASDHAPHTMQEKNRSYDQAPYGLSGVETLIPVVLTELYKRHKVDIFTIIKAISMNPMKVIGHDLNTFKEGDRPCFTLIDLNREKLIEKKDIISGGKNNPFISYKTECDVVMTVIKGEIVWRNI